MEITIYTRNTNREASYDRIATLLIVWSAEQARNEYYLEDGHITISPYTSTGHVSVRGKNGELLNRLVYRENWIIVDDSVVPLRIVEDIKRFFNKRPTFATNLIKVQQWCKDELLEMEANGNGLN